MKKFTELVYASATFIFSIVLLVVVAGVFIPR